tara:strand:+ start:1294 stop:1521 length:228 start_codon:yes stop_codon:yes gene_type:complete
MTKVFYLLLFLSTSTSPQYYQKGMYFTSMAECEIYKPVAIEVMKKESEQAGFVGVYIDAQCIEVKVQEYKPSLGT